MLRAGVLMYRPRVATAMAPMAMGVGISSRRGLSPVCPLFARRLVSSSTKTGNSTTPTKLGFFQSTWASYNALLIKHPLLTKVLTSAGIAAIGDVNAQLMLEGNESLDGKRTLTFTALGGLLIAPVLHVWYGFLGARVAGVSASAVTKRLALDQLVFAPAFLPLFLSTLLTLEGVPETIPEKLRADWWPVVKTNWYVWVPAQLLNFRFVPGSLQVLFSNVVGLFWNSYLSYVSHTSAEHVALTGSESETEPETETETESESPMAPLVS